MEQLMVTLRYRTIPYHKTTDDVAGRCATKVATCNIVSSFLLVVPAIIQTILNFNLRIITTVHFVKTNLFTSLGWYV